MKQLTIAMLALIISGSANAQIDSNLEALVAQAMAAPSRSAEDRARDANRKPVETLQFFGLRPDMKVLELIPGGGWYTRILAPTLKDGELVVALGARRVKEGLLAEPGFEQVRLLEPDHSEIARNEETRLYEIPEFTFGETGFDAVLTFRNMHNFGAEGRNRINAAAFAALKSGGIYGVVDHTRRHMEPANATNRRRADPVLIIKEAIDAGFQLVDFSDLHYRPNDKLELEVGEESVTGQTDRFTLLFKKP